MSKINLKDFLDVFESVGKRHDYFQGGGGNVSFKLSDNEMMIKSSGLRVKEVGLSSGLTSVNFKDIRYYFNGEILNEKDSDTFIKNSVLSNNGGRPSIETGFHAILGEVVIHSHSVYSNIFNCSNLFETGLKSIFQEDEALYKMVTYARPGHYLTCELNKILDEDLKKSHVIFLKNHGLIVSANSLEVVVALHEKVNNKLREYFNIKESYPIPKIRKIFEGRFVSNTFFIKEFLINNGEYFLNIQKYILFPDLIVFCKEISIKGEGDKNAKIIIDKESNVIIYNTNEKEASFIEENLLAFAYLIKNIKQRNLVPIYIDEKSAEDIEKMEAEVYRKSLVS